MSYVWKGRQYVVIAAGGHSKLNTKRGDQVIAFALAGIETWSTARTIVPMKSHLHSALASDARLLWKEAGGTRPRDERYWLAHVRARVAFAAHRMLRMQSRCEPCDDWGTLLSARSASAG